MIILIYPQQGTSRVLVYGIIIPMRVPFGVLIALQELLTKSSDTESKA